MRGRFLLLAAILIGNNGSAFDWPVAEVTVTATFAEHRGDHFHSGIDLKGADQPVLAAEAGEKIFSFEEGEDFSSLPSGLGCFCVLQHQGGIRSIYAHLKAGSMDPRKLLFKGKDPLGKVGNTGYSQGAHLHFTLLDSQNDLVLNPLLVLPRLKDSQAPVIRRIMLKSTRSQEETTADQKVPPGEALVLAEIYDLRTDVSFAWKLAPYKISLFQDGKAVSTYVFNSFQQKSGRLVLADTESSFSNIYEREWVFRLGTVKLAPGKTSLLVYASDFFGNESSRQEQFFVEAP